MVCQEMGAGDSRSWDAALRSVCSTRCMLYISVCCTSVYAVLGV